MHPRNHLKAEFIGKSVHIQRCTDPQWIGISGKVIDETKNTFLIDIDGHKKRIAKKNTTFEFIFGRKKIMIKGSHIQYRPEDRIKKIR